MSSHGRGMPRHVDLALTLRTMKLPMDAVAHKLTAGTLTDVEREQFAVRLEDVARQLRDVWKVDPV